MYTMIGTPQFSALEILRDEQYGPQVDLWSCGIILYNMLTGQLPFSVDEVLETFSTGDVHVPYPEKWWGTVSTQALKLTQQLLCKDPKARLSAAGALCSPWLSEDPDHVWKELLVVAEADSTEAEFKGGDPVGSSPSLDSREEVLILEAMSRTAKKRWLMAVMSVTLVIRLGALQLNRTIVGPAIESMSSLASESSCADSDWDYSEADFDYLSGVNSIDSASPDLKLDRRRSRDKEELGDSRQRAALKWQESIVSVGDRIDRGQSRRERVSLTSNFERVSKTDGGQGRGFQRNRVSCASLSESNTPSTSPKEESVPSPSPRAVNGTASAIETETETSAGEPLSPISRRKLKEWASVKLVAGLKSILLKHKRT